MTSDTDGPPARPAATVLLLRDADAGIEVHMQRRHAEMSFGSRAFVFPGGAMDAADTGQVVLDPLRGVDLSGAAHRMHLEGNAEERRECAGLHVCAVRELFEEAGLLLAVDGEGAPHRNVTALAPVRARLLEGGDLGAELAALRLRVHAEALTYVAHFITPLGLPRRYDTRFFVVRAAAGVEPAVHAGEATEGGWYTASSMLAAADRREAVLMPPTRILLEELRRHEDVDGVLADLGSRPVASILFAMRHLALPVPDHLPGVAEVAAMEAALT